MTVLLRSNVKFSNSVGNLHGYTGPGDYRALLDFSREKYVLQTTGAFVNYSLAQAVTVARATPAEYVDRYGNFQTATVGAPRIRLLPDVGIVGLSSEDGITNLIPSPLAPTNGQAVTITAASTSMPIALSYYGTGSAVLTSDSLTLFATLDAGNGRTVKLYTRSVSAAIAATLDFTGSVSRAQAELSYGATTFMAGSRNAEVIKLNAPFKDLFAAGAGTIIVRGVYNKVGPVAILFSPIRVTKTGAEFGGAQLVSTNSVTTGTASVNTALDGAAAAGTVRSTVTTGGQKRSPVYGIGISGFGESARVIQFGKTGITSGLTALFSAPDKVELNPINGVITHIVMYDRLLTELESQIVANQWMAAI